VRLGTRLVSFVHQHRYKPRGRAAYLFAALSHACHYHPNELAPTAAELTGWLDQAAQIVTQLQSATSPPATQT
jgi:hypothetical protein